MERAAENPVVLVAINDFLMGGAQKMMAEILSHLDSKRYKLHLLILADYPEKDSFYSLIPAGVTIHRLSVTSPYDIRGLLQVIRFLRTLRPATIVSNLYLCNTVMRVAAKILNIPVIVVEHNTYKDKNFLQHGVDWVLSWTSYKIIAVSEGVAEYIITRQHISRKKIVIIPNGIDDQPLQAAASLLTRESVRGNLGIPPQELVLLHVGRLVTQKDPALLLSGFAEFANSSQKSCRIIMVGGGPLLKTLEAQAESLGIRDQVLFTGAADPNPYYIASDVFVTTSHIEGFGLVRVEALWFGLPVVTTVTGGTKELILEGENGILIYERTPESVAEAIRRTLSLDSERVRVCARETGKRFTIERTAQAYSRIIDESLARA